MSVFEWLRKQRNEIQLRLGEAATPHSRDIPFRWDVKPFLKPGAKICLFVVYAPTGMISEHSAFHAKAWAQAGFEVVAIIVTDDLSQDIDNACLGFAAGILIRRNVGYDFGAWAAAIGQLPELSTASLLVTANDSVYGPLNNFNEMLALLQTMDGDVIGLSDSFEIQHHLQSFILFFRPKALTSRFFWKFWRSIRSGDRKLVINLYELRLLSAFKQHGMRCIALFPADTSFDRNQTLFLWRELIERGFPFIKVQLLRDNPNGVDISGWEGILAARGYEPELVLRHLKLSRQT